MRIIVDRDLCESNAACVRRAPAVFQLDDENRLVIVDERPGPELADDVRQAVKRCPRGALALVAGDGA
jgi:ferredoxin